MAGENNSSEKVWLIRVVYGVISIWLASVAASSTIKVMFYIAFVALPLWIPGGYSVLAEAQYYIEMYMQAIHLFVILLFSVNFIKAFGTDTWRNGRFNKNMIKYPITAIGLTILSNMLDTSRNMHPATFFTVIGIAIGSYIVINWVSASIEV